LDKFVQGSQQFVRLLRLSCAGVATELARIPDHGQKRPLYVTTTYDGLLLLSGSGPSKAGRPFYVLIDPSGAEAKAVGWFKPQRTGALLQPPDVLHPEVYAVAIQLPGNRGIELGEVERAEFTLIAPTQVAQALPEPL
jgi:hypothetical protein